MQVCQWVEKLNNDTLKKLATVACQLKSVKNPFYVFQVVHIIHFCVFHSNNFTKIWVSHNLFFSFFFFFTMGLKLQVAFIGSYSQSTLQHHFQHDVESHEIPLKTSQLCKSQEYGSWFTDLFFIIIIYFYCILFCWHPQRASNSKSGTEKTKQNKKTQHK